MARFFGAGKEMPNIKELGLYAILSYGFVSNASYAICIGLAWFASSKKTGEQAYFVKPVASKWWCSVVVLSLLGGFSSRVSCCC